MLIGTYMGAQFFKKFALNSYSFKIYVQIFFSQNSSKIYYFYFLSFYTSFII